jgi:hypothetical protein
MTFTVTNNIKAATLIVLALAIGAMGIYVGQADDAPGAGGMGLLLMIGGIVLGMKAARGRLPVWAARTALAVGILIAAFAALLTYGVTRRASVFVQPQEVPSVIDSAPPPQYVAAAARARELVRAAIVEQNLPGLSVAVGAALPSGASAKEGQIIWAEGFGWRDVQTRTPVTPKTRFHIGTAASAVTADVVARLALVNTGAEPPAEWSPEHIGEPEEDFPPFTIMRHAVFQPIGLAPAEYPIPGERATFYVPRSDNDPRSGRQLMSMRDLACCAEKMASYSTPSDLVRVGLANGGSINGELAGGMVMSLLTLRDGGIAVAVLANIAHANTSALAVKIGEAFSKQAP